MKFCICFTYILFTVAAKFGIYMSNDTTLGESYSEVKKEGYSSTTNILKSK